MVYFFEELARLMVVLDCLIEALLEIFEDSFFSERILLCVVFCLRREEDFCVIFVKVAELEFLQSLAIDIVLAASYIILSLFVNFLRVFSCS